MALILSRPWKHLKTRICRLLVEDRSLVKQALPGSPQAEDTGTRTKGRPLRGTTEIGRERLIEKTRELLKSRPRFDVQRQEIADFAGVTPALVTYHFPNKWRLFEEAIASVIDEQISRIQVMVATPDPDLGTLRSLIEVFVIFHVDYGSLLDNYIELIAVNQSDGNRNRLLHVQSAIRGFLVKLINRGLFKNGDIDILQTALWGACKYLGQTLKMRANLNAEDRRRRIDASIDTVLSLFVIAGVETPRSGTGATTV